MVTKTIDPWGKSVLVKGLPEKQWLSCRGKGQAGFKSGGRGWGEDGKDHVCEKNIPGRMNIWKKNLIKKEKWCFEK